MNRFWLINSIILLCLVSHQSLAVGGNTISWQEWDKATFDRAITENKLIMLNVGMEGCAACGRMESVTYAHPGVIAMLEENFIAIAVDSEARPDIGERYSDWAWPATIFLKPDSTQVLALRGNRMPRNFIPILEDLNKKHEAGVLEPDPNSPYTSPPKPIETKLSRVRDQVRAQIDRQLNEKDGGWSSRGVRNETSGHRLKHLYLRAHMYDQDELRTLALKTTDAMIRGIDPVWGGAYVMTLHGSTDDKAKGFRRLGGIPEMRITAQSNTMAAAAEAYQFTGDPKYLAAAKNVDRYLRLWMMAKDGEFYTNQKGTPLDLPREMDDLDYWSLKTDAERRQYGTPPVDHAIYTDKNSEVIIAYVHAYEAFSDKAFLDTAIRAANALIDKRMQKEGWILQATDNQLIEGDKRLRPYETQPRPFLSAQAWFGSAMMALYRVTSDEKWLNHARTIAMTLRELLEDKQNGGFFATIPDNTAAIIPIRKPLEDNGTAAHFYYDLWVYTKDDQFKAVPERTLRAVADPEILRHEGKVTGQLALALEKVTAAYVEFSVVGDRSDPRTVALFDEARKTYHPRKLAHYEKPGRYPDRGKPAMYICNPDMCTLPIEDPALVAKQVQSFRGPATTVN